MPKVNLSSTAREALAEMLESPAWAVALKVLQHEQALTTDRITAGARALAGPEKAVTYHTGRFDGANEFVAELYRTVDQPEAARKFLH